MNTAPCPTYLVAHITDLHIKAGGRLSYRLVDTAGALHRCIDTLLAAPQQPDAVIVTGDLVDFGAASEYQFLREILQRLPMPVRLLPGNHDSRGALRQVFADHDYLFATGSGEDPVHYSIDAGPLRLVAFDCTVPGQPGGRVDPAALPWLEAALSADPDRPTLLLLHHPPFFTGIGHMDEQGLANADALEAVVRRHPQVERVLCGHLHRHITRRFGGTVAMTAPGPAHQVALDLDRHAPSRFRMEPPGYLLHWWHPAHGLVTHAAAIGDYGAAHPFFDAQGKLID
ncbi:phosphodiesterase [Cupriavidus alkaliphilus]|uniref:3',5'-cyclic AMP phosphodiesterase CpdA n=1 Tax=Cupriavidus alkaliphilus TaxID=942866 RepID=A0A7W4VEW2_9BURK|nr:phosphodiesterase [Cupriavidus alkaliphilus]MBB3009625.1 3',5'-cyclic AMP phosphodiesterase CpdA [Cupriavidus alkaliphilus]